MTDSGRLGDQTPSIEYWAHKPAATRGPVPYPYPADRKYNTSSGPVPGKINVHLVPHSHDDTGWQVTVDQYFAREVFYTIDTVVANLAKDVNRKFIYVETAFFARWWEQASDEKRELARAAVNAGQLEFINGGWCMHDEASPLWTSMMDQTTRGHQFLFKNFGAKATPRGTWQIDPFGHSQTEAWLLGTEAGFESLFWGRMDWQDRTMRYKKQQGTDGFEWVWQGSRSLGASSRIFAGNLFGTGNGGYSTWINFDGAGAQVNDDPARHDWNVDQWVDKFVQDALSQANHTLGMDQIWACGTDFQYQNADHWYHNLDKLIHYVNLNGTVNAFYSTPTRYVEQKKKWKGSFELRADDIFPLADNAHNYWSGYFTSRPALKRQVRFATNLLGAARQLELVTRTTADEINVTTAKRSPPVGDSWTDSLEGTVGVATHHDGMSGTERQDVTDDYEQRISESSFEVEAGLSVALGKLLGVPAAAVEHCNCNVGGNCLNMSVCAATTGVGAFTVAAWNPLAHAVSDIARIPVNGADWAVTDGAGKAVPSQTVALDDRTKALPLLYVNTYQMDAGQIAAAEAALANKADHVLIFDMPMPPVGLATFAAKAAAAPVEAVEAVEAAEVEATAAEAAAPLVVRSDTYELSFDGESGLLASITNRKSGASTPLSIQWGWYNSSVGGCTAYGDDVPASLRSPPCSGQKSGAYIFRPNSSTFFYPGGSPRKPTTTVVRGALLTEVRESGSPPTARRPHTPAHARTRPRAPSRALTRPHPPPTCPRAGSPALLRVGDARGAPLRRQAVRGGRVDGGAHPDRHAVVRAGRAQQDDARAAAEHVGQGAGGAVRVGPQVERRVAHRLERQGDGAARVQPARPVVPTQVQHLGARRGQLLPGQRDHLARRRRARACRPHRRVAGDPYNHHVTTGVTTVVTTASPSSPTRRRRAAR